MKDASACQPAPMAQEQLQELCWADDGHALEFLNSANAPVAGNDVLYASLVRTVQDAVICQTEFGYCRLSYSVNNVAAEAEKGVRFLNAALTPVEVFSE